MTATPDASSAETGLEAEGPDEPPHANSIPLPAAEAGSFEKEPGFTTLGLHNLVLSGGSTRASRSPSPPVSESDCYSPTSSSIAPSAAVSRSGSRAASFSASAPPSRPGSQPPTRQPSSTQETVKAPSSAKSDSGGGHKFSLKELLASGPKLSRRSSQKSQGSAKSGGGGGGGTGPRSAAGDSVASLTQKYGVCQKVAIGKGATSVVRLAHKWDRTVEKLYAVKEFRKRRKNESEKEYVKKLTAEFCISSTLHHINIVETVDLVQDEQARWCEVMEFCPGGDLYAAIKKGGMSPSEVECCFKQIITGVDYLHSQGVAHRDLKPENIFFDTKGHVKIGDYGASTVYRLPWEATIHMSTGLCGSEPYIAPEQFIGKQAYDARLVDIWACGIVYYCLHFQELPWVVAQPTNPLYAAYATACIAAPYGAPPGTPAHTVAASFSSGGSKSKPTSGASSPPPAPPMSTASSASSTTTAPSLSHTASGVPNFPPTISNLSPRGCRALIRRMLEPNPKLRAPIEEVMAHPWIAGIEVCYLVDNPKHVHVNARAMAAAMGV